MDVATMRRAFPGLSAARAAELNSGLNTALRLAGCTTVKRVAMFCAQVGEESISLTAPTELGSGAEYEGRADLGNASAHVVTVPNAIHAFVAHRLDGGSNDISVAFSA